MGLQIENVSKTISTLCFAEEVAETLLVKVSLSPAAENTVYLGSSILDLSLLTGFSGGL